MELYIGRCKNTVVQYIATSTILDFYLEVEIRSGERVVKYWWRHPGLSLAVTQGGRGGKWGGGVIGAKRKTHQEKV